MILVCVNADNLPSVKMLQGKKIQAAIFMWSHQNSSLYLYFQSPWGGLQAHMNEEMCFVLWFYLMQTKYTLVHSRAASHMHLFTAEKVKTTTQAALHALSATCVCFLNSRGGENRLQEQEKQCLCPMAHSPSHFTFKVKAK